MSGTSTCMFTCIYIYFYTVCVDIMCIRRNASLYCVNVVADNNYYILDSAGLYLEKVMGVTVIKMI